MPPAPNLAPDRGEIIAALERQTARWHELGEKCWLELRAINADVGIVYHGRFNPRDLEEAADFAISMNATGRGIYSVRNPIRYDGPLTAAKDTDILAAFAVFADCDDEISARNLLDTAGPRPTYTVITGRIPHPRPHPYWELTEPVRDMEAWRELQKQIARALGSDNKVVNPSRIMRLPGTVTYPPKHKRERGYISELVTAQYPDREPVPFEQLQRAFGAAAGAAQSAAQASSGFDIDTGHTPMDRALAAASVVAGDNWHDNVIRLVGSYVSRGLSDDEIHAITDGFTLAGYTVEQTRREVQQAIDGARAKGWAPEQPPVPNFDAPEATPAPNQDSQQNVEKIPFKRWEVIDLRTIKRTQFVYSDFYARGYTSLTVAAPKVGKSMLALAECIDMATGRGFLTGQPRDPLRVVYYNAEDDQNVLNGRVSALLTHYGIDQSEIENTLQIQSGVEWEGFLLSYGDSGEINEPLFAQLEHTLREDDVDVFFADPLQDLTDAPESNDVFRRLGRRLRRLATQTRTSIGIVHHTRKMMQGVQNQTIEDARGGGALRGTSRFNRILVPMTEQEAAKAGVDNHRWFLRIGDMESNLAPPSADVNRWFRKVSVDCPHGEYVGAVEPWEWPDAFDGVTPEDAARVQAAIRRLDTPPRASSQSKEWVGYLVCDVLGMDSDDKGHRQRASTMIRTWLETDVLRRDEFIDANSAKRPVIICGENDPLAGGA